MCAKADVPLHVDGVQAVGSIPVDATLATTFAVSAHKLGGPLGAGALIARRGLDLTPLIHGGGQERQVRSGTVDVPAMVGFAAALQDAMTDLPDRAARLEALRDCLVAGVLRECPEAIVNGAPGAGRLPGNAHLSFPGCEGDALLMLLDAAGVQVSTGSACSAGVPEPSHVLLAMGIDPVLARSSLRLTLGPHLHTGRRRCLARGAACGGGPGPARRPGPGQPRTVRGRPQRGVSAMRVLAAMSGGVDSAVAAARMVAAGHEVTGVHLALSRTRESQRSGARGCCTLEDSRDAWRAADLLQIPFYVWDMSEEFTAEVVDDFLAEYAAGRTPNPCLRCNERIKFAAVLDRAAGPRVRRGGHRSLRAAGRRARGPRAASGGGPGQGPVLRARRPGLRPVGGLPVPAR